MKYLVKDEYYDLKDEIRVLHSVYSIIDDDSVKLAIMHDLANVIGLPTNHWEKLFDDGIIGRGTSEIYEFKDGHTVSENLIDSIREDHEEIKAGDLNED